MTGTVSSTWSPLRDAATVSGAAKAARHIVEAAPRGDSSVEENDFWSKSAESLLAALLVVAANSKDRTFADIVRWVVATDMPREANVEPGAVQSPTGRWG